MSDFYYLNEDKSVRPCTPQEWSAQFITLEDKRYLGRDIIDGVNIQTVWTGVNLAPLDKPAEVFQTMVWGKEVEQTVYFGHYATWEAALEGHKQALEAYKNKSELI